jgi:hypothetical protein
VHKKEQTNKTNARSPEHDPAKKELTQVTLMLNRRFLFAASAIVCEQRKKTKRQFLPFVSEE